MRGPSGRRDVLKADIGAALSLAIGNSPAEALRALSEIDRGDVLDDDELAARYQQAVAVAHIKARDVAGGFSAFARALDAARRHGEPLMLAKILNNYSAAAIQDGSVDHAIRFAREALQHFRDADNSVSIGLVTLGEALYAGGALSECATILHEFHAIQHSDASTERAVTQDHVLLVASVGIPVGLALSDAALVRINTSPTVLDVAFNRNADWLLGPVAEAFCGWYEYDDNRAAHDALVLRAASTMRTVDQSLAFAVRVARCGPPELLARFSGLVKRHCAPGTPLMRSYEDLFAAAASIRRDDRESAESFGAAAAAGFLSTGRPLPAAVAEDVGGRLDRAQSIRAGCGARTDALHGRWWGERVAKRLGTALTARETEVALLIAKGEAYKEIAASLCLSERTIHRHCESIFSKLGIHSRWQLPAVLADTSRGLSRAMGSLRMTPT